MIEALSPHQAGQGSMFPVETAFGPLVMTVAVSLQRIPRRRCDGCGKRRVLFFVGLGEIITSPRLCAKCSGIR